LAVTIANVPRTKNARHFWGLRVDRSVAQEVIDRLQPLGVEAALAAMNDHGKEQPDKRRQSENALEQARFESGRAHRHTTKSIHPTDLSLPSWSGVGMRDWSMFVLLKSNLLNAL
jgi:hypothetical protein